MLGTAIAALIVGGIAVAWGSSPDGSDVRRGFALAGSFALIASIACLLGLGIQSVIDSQSAEQKRLERLREAGALYGNPDDWPQPVPAET